MNYRLLIAITPTAILWAYYTLKLTAMGNLPYIIGGVALIMLAIILDRLDYVGFTSQILFLLLVSIILAITGYVVLVEVVFLALPLAFILYCTTRKIKLEYLLLVSPIIYVYTLIISYLVDMGYGLRAPLLIIPLMARVVGLVSQGYIPGIVSYEPLPGIIPLYFTSIILLLILYDYKVPPSVYISGLGRVLLASIPLTILIAYVHITYRLVHVTITCLILIIALSALILYKIVKT